jgi:hypothetical protein
MHRRTIRRAAAERIQAVARGWMHRRAVAQLSIRGEMIHQEDGQDAEPNVPVIQEDGQQDAEPIVPVIQEDAQEARPLLPRIQSVALPARGALRIVCTFKSVLQYTRRLECQNKSYQKNLGNTDFILNDVWCSGMHKFLLVD